MNNTRILAAIAAVLCIAGFVGAAVLKSVYASNVRTDAYVHAHKVSNRGYSGPRYLYLTDQQETVYTVLLYLGIGGAAFFLVLAAWVRWAMRE